MPWKIVGALYKLDRSSQLVIHVKQVIHNALLKLLLIDRILMNCTLTK